MSVCIASKADSGKTIVFATDQLLSSQTATFEGSVVKADFIDVNWLAMWAGDDISSVAEIRERANDALPKSGVATKFQAANALTDAVQEVTRDHATAQYLSPFDLDMRGFHAKGAKVFGAEHSWVIQEIARFDLGLTFLVAGFNVNDSALFTIDGRGRPKFDRRGYDAIGSGHPLALAALSLSGHRPERTTQETIYAVLNAKFAAEHAPGVGRRTTIGVMHPFTLIEFVPEETVAVVRRAWERRSVEAMPDEVVSSIHGWWVPRRDAMEKAQRAQLERNVRLLRERLKARSVPKRSTRGRKVRPPSQE